MHHNGSSQIAGPVLEQVQHQALAAATVFHRAAGVHWQAKEDLYAAGAAAALAGLGTWRWRSLDRGGFATRAQLSRTMTRRAMLRGLEATRPALFQNTTRRERRRLPHNRVGTMLGRCAMQPMTDVVVPYEEAILALGPPRSGKTQWIASKLIDHDGPAISTSTKIDIYVATMCMRTAGHGVDATTGDAATMGGDAEVVGQEPTGEPPRAWLFNPESLSRLESTFRWSPVSGCEDPETAIARAGYLLSGSPGAEGVTNKSFWEGQSYDVLRSLLHAAALDGRGMRDVWRWATNPQDATPVQILSQAKGAAEGWGRDLGSTMKLPQDTRGNIYGSLKLALQFMASPSVAACMEPDAAHPEFDIDKFLATPGDTLYLVASNRAHGSIAPLFSTFTGALFERAKVVASYRIGERLDPPMLIALDEAALICPVPLEDWIADAGGRGISLIIGVQSWHQFVQRYTENGALVIWECATCKVILGGITSPRALEMIVKILGDHRVKQVTYSRAPGGGTSEHTAWVKEDLMSAAQINGLDPWSALVKVRSSRPTIIRFVPLYKQRSWRKSRKDAIASGRWPVDVDFKLFADEGDDEPAGISA